MIFSSASIVFLGFLSGNTPLHAGPNSGAHIAIRLGIGAETCAAAGMTAASTDSFLLNLQDASAAQQALRGKWASVDAISANLVDVLETLETDPGNPQLIESRVSLETSLAEARAELVEARRALLLAGLQGIDQDEAARVVRALGRGATTLPPSVGVSDLSQMAARRASGAIRTAGRSLVTGKPAPNEAAETMSVLNSRSDVIEAKSKVVANLAAVQAVFAANLTTQ